ncbi:MAG: beta-propeller fold lactonase family protein [Myxococcota bacterium]
MHARERRGRDALATIALLALGTAPEAADAGILRTTDAALAAAFMQGASIESFDDLPAFATSTYAAGQTLDPSARFNTRDGVAQPTFNSGGGTFSDPVGNPGVPIAIVRPTGAIASDVVSPDRVAAPVVTNDPLQPFANGFIEVFFPDGASRVGFWVTHGEVSLNVFDRAGMGFTNGDATTTAIAGEFVGIDRGAREIGIASILPHGVDAFTIDDFVWSGTDASAELASRLAFAGLTLDGEDASDLVGPTASAMSPDGGHLYVAAGSGNALVVLRREPATGLLEFVESHRDGVSGVDGLGFPQAVAVSPDGATVYVTASEGTLAAFARDRDDGHLTFLEVHREGAAGVSGIAQPFDLHVSADGDHVYVAGHVSQAVALFARDASTGRLVFQGKTTAGLLDAGALPDHVCASPDGASLYVASFFGTITVFTRNPATGTLSLVEVEPFLSDTHSCAVSPDGRFLYTGSREGVLRILSRDGTTGALRPAGASVAPAGYATSLALSADGRRLYVHDGSDGFSVYVRDAATGSLLLLERIVAGTGGVQGIRSGSPFVQSAFAPSPDARHLYVLGAEDDAVGVFSAPIVASTGSVQTMVDGQAESNGLPLSVAISPDSRFAYVAGFNTSSISVFAIDHASDELVLLERKREGDLDPTSGLFVFGLSEVSDLVVSPDGNQVYASGKSLGAVVRFDRNADGSLVYRGSHFDPRIAKSFGIAMSNDGTSVYATSSVNGAWMAFDRSIDGALVPRPPTPTSGDVDGASGLAVLPDGDAVAITWSPGNEGGLRMYRREPSGDLSFRSGSATGGLTAQRVAASANGQDLYVTLQGGMNGPGQLRHFHWNPTSEVLTALESILDTPTGAVQGIRFPLGIAVSPDDRHVAVAGAGSDGISLFTRDPATGTLVLAQNALAANAPDAGLDEALDVVFTPDGRYLLVSGGGDRGTLGLFAVPEPSGVAPILLGGGALALAARERSRRALRRAARRHLTRTLGTPACARPDQAGRAPAKVVTPFKPCVAAVEPGGACTTRGSTRCGPWSR